MDRYTTETLGELVAAQTVVNDPMRAALAKHGPAVAVEVVRKDTPFGTFVIGWRVIGRTLTEDLRVVPAEGSPCGSGWTGDRCTKRLGHSGDHSNEGGR